MKIVEFSSTSEDEAHGDVASRSKEYASNGDHNLLLEKAWPLRPSTARRTEKLRALLAELSVRDMGYVAVAVHLKCSASSARNYVRELLDLRVIVPSPIKQPAGAVDRAVFRLNVDTVCPCGFNWTDNTKRGSGNIAPGSGMSELDADRIHRLFRPSPPNSTSTPRRATGTAWRDPLVTALFGSPSLPNRGCGQD